MFMQHKANTKVTPLTVPTISIKSIAYEKMVYYVADCEKEIGWLGEVEKKDNQYIINDVFLFEQESDATTCEITPESVCKFMEDMILGDKENGMARANRLRLWGHSHVRMGVTPSGQDETQMETFKKNGSDFFIMVIGNKKGDLRFELWDFITGLRYEDVQWQHYILSQIHRDKIKEEIEKKVKTITYKTANITTTGEKKHWWDYGYRSAYGSEYACYQNEKKEEEQKEKTTLTEEEEDAYLDVYTEVLSYLTEYDCLHLAEVPVDVARKYILDEVGYELDDQMIQQIQQESRETLAQIYGGVW
jgi:hypothetical protein